MPLFGVSRKMYASFFVILSRLSVRRLPKMQTSMLQVINPLWRQCTLVSFNPLLVVAYLLSSEMGTTPAPSRLGFGSSEYVYVGLILDIWQSDWSFGAPSRIGEKLTEMWSQHWITGSVSKSLAGVPGWRPNCRPWGNVNISILTKYIIILIETCLQLRSSVRGKGGLIMLHSHTTWFLDLNSPLLQDSANANTSEADVIQLIRVYLKLWDVPC